MKIAHICISSLNWRQHNLKANRGTTPTIRSIKTAAISGSVLVLLGIYSYLFPQHATQPTTETKASMSTSTSGLKGKQAATLHKTKDATYSISGKVSVGFPNFSGVLPVVFIGHFDDGSQGQLRIVVDGTPVPSGSLILKSSSANISIVDISTFRGRITQFTPVSLRLSLTSASGKTYAGIFYTRINGLSHTFTGNLSLRPLDTQSS